MPSSSRVSSLGSNLEAFVAIEPAYRCQLSRQGPSWSRIGPFGFHLCQQEPSYPASSTLSVPFWIVVATGGYFLHLSHLKGVLHLHLPLSSCLGPS